MKNKINKLINQIRLKANGARMHLDGAGSDKEKIYKKRNLLNLYTIAKDRRRIIRKINCDKKNFEESSCIYKGNLGFIKDSIESIEKDNSKISRYIIKKQVNKQAVMNRAIHAAGEFYGENIPDFPEAPAGVQV
jgi:hypothetical protein